MTSFLRPQGSHGRNAPMQIDRRNVIETCFVNRDELAYFDNAYAPWQGNLWPRSRFAGGSTDYGFGGCMMLGDCSAPYAQMPAHKGSSSQKRIRGITRNSTGTPEGNAVVLGYLWTTRAFVSETISNGFGEFEIMTTNPSVAHFVVAYKDGAPDVAAMSANDLIPSD